MFGLVSKEGGILQENMAVGILSKTVDLWFFWQFRIDLHWGAQLAIAAEELWYITDK